MKNKDLYIKRLVAQGMAEDEATKFINLIEMDALISDDSFYINVHYTTGDSFSSYETDSEINLPWHNIGVIQENIKRLEEQNRLYNIIDCSYSDKEDVDDALNKWFNADWAVFYEENERYSHFGWKFNDKYIKQYSIKLLKDDGTEFQISTSAWMGYFEHSQSFSIEKVNKHTLIN